MNIIVYSKTNCPFCVKAKTLLTAKGLKFQEVQVTDPTQLPKPEFRTVPQIVIDTNFIGGFNELVSYFNNLPKQKTVFNKNNTGHLTGQYPLFLGEDLGFSDTVNNPYPVLEELFHKQSAQIWNAMEIDLTQDRMDMLGAPRELVDLMVKNILWQSLADSVASRAIGSVLVGNVSNSSLQDLYNAIIYFESIHNITYQHIIKQTFVDPNQALIQGYANLEVIKRSNILVDSFDNLARGANESIENKRKLILFSVLAMYLLEAINFMASFACTFAIAERGYFQGIAQDVVLIARDEVLHAKAGGTILSILKSQWPDAWGALKPQLEGMLNAIIQDEHAWADYLFTEGRQVIGLNSQLLKDYVDYCAEPVRTTLDIPQKGLNKNPLPYMEVYLDSSKTQTAAQEMQLTAYLVNAVKASPESEVLGLLKSLREDLYL